MTTEVIHLCFHGVGRPGRSLEPGEGAYWVGTAAFHAILDAVAEDPRVRLSFDDGNSSDLEIVLPALLERGLVATFFVLAGRLDQPGSLSAAEVRGLAAKGMLIGSHGMHHVPWRGLDPAGVRRELVEARDLLSSVVGRPVDEAALPLGRYDRRALTHLRRLGYRSVHSSDRAWSSEGAWLRPRFSVRRGDTAETVRRAVLTRDATPRRLRVQVAGVVKRWR